jgi:hypothetical protein
MEGLFSAKPCREVCALRGMLAVFDWRGSDVPHLDRQRQRLGCAICDRRLPEGATRKGFVQVLGEQGPLKSTVTSTTLPINSAARENQSCLMLHRILGLAAFPNGYETPYREAWHCSFKVKRVNAYNLSVAMRSMTSVCVTG